MPELPDITVYLEALAPRVLGQPIVATRLRSAFLLRSVQPRLSTVIGRKVVGLERLGKRIVFVLEGELFLVLHLMIAGRLRWKPVGTAAPKRNGLLALDFPTGSLLLTEAGSKKRASLHVIEGREALAQHDPGGLEVLGASPEDLERALRRENRTLKRALTDPRILSGIGNAYSDEILHRARCSPFRRTGDLTGEEVRALGSTITEVLEEWIERLRREVGEGFPDKVTAFHPEMAVHGRYKKPCPVCASPVQRILYAENEANYCATCQTGGKLLADRVLSRLLKDDWPKTLEELEAKMNPQR
ncbi:MAG: formamidopyrimidine-DNA glycosylase [Thermoanaerobaculia bacterium]|nr:formamidopyrimidine-DNA glycosylase [Thermoanaerobaculia bacterium]